MTYNTKSIDNEKKNVQSDDPCLQPPSEHTGARSEGAREQEWCASATQGRAGQGAGESYILLYISDKAYFKRLFGIL